MRCRKAFRQAFPGGATLRPRERSPRRSRAEAPGASSRPCSARGARTRPTQGAAGRAGGGQRRGGARSGSQGASPRLGSWKRICTLPFEGVPLKSTRRVSHARFFPSGVAWKGRRKKRASHEKRRGRDRRALPAARLLPAGSSMQFRGEARSRPLPSTALRQRRPGESGRESQSRWRLAGLGRGGDVLFFFFYCFPHVPFHFFIKKLTLCICAITTCHDNGQTLEMPRLLTQHKMNSNRKWCTFS